VAEQETFELISTLVWLAMRCGLGQTALRAQNPFPARNYLRCAAVAVSMEA
jgi:hypothetical protein